jgi:hypothetical protein
MDFEEFSFSLCNLLAFKSEDSYHHLNALGVDWGTWDLVEQSVWVKIEIGLGNSIGFYFSRKKVPLSSSERLKVTESILKELE